MAEFAHLHLHTEYSLLDGLGKMPEYIEKANEVGIQHIAVTDHGVMYASYEWFKRATEAGLHPIVGMEAYMAEGAASARERKSYHLLLLAENMEGYRNLLRLASRAQLEGYYYRPRVDLAMLQEHHSGLIATSACLGGPVANNIIGEQIDAARRYAGTLSEIFGPERFYLEIQDHGIPEQIVANRELIPMARDLGLPLVATNDVHYVNEGDAPYQDLLVCIQTNTTISDPKRLKSDTNQLYFKSPEEMELVFGAHPEALANTLRIAEMCEVDLNAKELLLPDFQVPEGFTQDSYLEHLCREGVKRLYGHDTGEVGTRLEYELQVIRNMGFTGYFLIVWDFIRYARENGISVGPGRGSAAASIVTYSLGITALDPLRYGLIFERFLNPSRISMPDIDIDFADSGRDQVIRYVVDKYGSDKVAQIVTFGTLAAKASVRDIGKAMELPSIEIDRIAKLIPNTPKITIKDAMEEVPELKALYDTDTRAREVIDAAQKVEGVARHASTHAAGVVISREKLINTVPLQRAGGKSEGDITTQYPMGQLESIGLLKMDFLGLSTLTILDKAVAMANAKDPDLTVEGIALDDPAIYEMLQRGETGGVFQLEGGMTTRMTINTQPDKFEDIIALMALIRPGPMELAPDYIARKRGETEVAYIHPELESILSETYGVALYQEQIIQIANQIAGLSMAESDEIRKAMGKKDADVMAKVKGRFVEGCLRRQLDPNIANSIWAVIERFAGYGFNKAHSAAYAVIAAQTAFMRAKYPVEFMAAVLSVGIGSTDKVVYDLTECRRTGIPVIPPDINRSLRDFSATRLDDGTEAVLFGLGAIRNVGDGAIAAIIEAREAQPDGMFVSLDALCAALDWDAVSRRVLEGLAKAGALDVFGHRGAVLANLDRAVSAGQSQFKAKARGQIGLFGGEEQAIQAAAARVLEGPLMDQMELLSAEKEAIGIYLSSHPLAAAIGDRLPPGHYEIVQLGDRAAGSQVKVICSIRGIRRIQTRTNASMAVLELEDLSGRIDMVMYPEIFQAYGAALSVDQIITVTARTDYRNDELQLVAIEISSDVEKVEAPEPSRTVLISIPRKSEFWESVEVLQKLDQILSGHEGSDQVVLDVTINGARKQIRSRKHLVEWSDSLATEVAEQIGADCVTVVDAA